MPFSIEIQDRATPPVEGVWSELQLSGVKPEIGRSVVNLVQQHFLRLNSSRPNPLGGARSNFYALAARNTTFQVTPDGVQLSVDQVGLRQRLQGGQIVPRQAGYLTIPAVAEAYGRRARDFNNLEVMWRRIGGQTRAVALVEAAAKSPRGPAGPARTRGITTETAGGRVFYWLVKSVTQQGDPTVLPSDQQLTATAVQAAETYFAALLRKTK